MPIKKVQYKEVMGRYSLLLTRIILLTFLLTSLSFSQEQQTCGPHEVFPLDNNRGLASLGPDLKLIEESLFNFDDDAGFPPITNQQMLCAEPVGRYCLESQDGKELFFWLIRESKSLVSEFSERGKVNQNRLLQSHRKRMSEVMMEMEARLKSLDMPASDLVKIIDYMISFSDFDRDGIVEEYLFESRLLIQSYRLFNQFRLNPNYSDDAIYDRNYDAEKLGTILIKRLINHPNAHGDLLLEVSVSISPGGVGAGESTKLNENGVLTISPEYVNRKEIFHRILNAVTEEDSHHYQSIDGTLASLWFLNDLYEQGLLSSEEYGDANDQLVNLESFGEELSVKEEQLLMENDRFEVDLGELDEVDNYTEYRKKVDYEMGRDLPSTGFINTIKNIVIAPFDIIVLTPGFHLMGIFKDKDKMIENAIIEKAEDLDAIKLYFNIQPIVDDNLSHEELDDLNKEIEQKNKRRIKRIAKDCSDDNDVGFMPLASTASLTAKINNCFAVEIILKIFQETMGHPIRLSRFETNDKLKALAKATARPLTQCLNKANTNLKVEECTRRFERWGPYLMGHHMYRPLFYDTFRDIALQKSGLPDEKWLESQYENSLVNFDQCMESEYFPALDRATLKNEKFDAKAFLQGCLFKSFLEVMAPLIEGMVRDTLGGIVQTEVDLAVEQSLAGIYQCLYDHHVSSTNDLLTPNTKFLRTSAQDDVLTILKEKCTQDVVLKMLIIHELGQSEQTKDVLSLYKRKLIANKIFNEAYLPCMQTLKEQANREIESISNYLDPSQKRIEIRRIKSKISVNVCIDLIKSMAMGEGFLAILESKAKETLDGLWESMLDEAEQAGKALLAIKNHEDYESIFKHEKFEDQDLRELENYLREHLLEQELIDELLEVTQVGRLVGFTKNALNKKFNELARRFKNDIAKEKLSFRNDALFSQKMLVASCFKTQEYLLKNWIREEATPAEVTEREQIRCITKGIAKSGYVLAKNTLKFMREYDPKFVQYADVLTDELITELGKAMENCLETEFIEVRTLDQVGRVAEKAPGVCQLELYHLALEKILPHVLNDTIRDKLPDLATWRREKLVGDFLHDFLGGSNALKLQLMTNINNGTLTTEAAIDDYKVYMDTIEAEATWHILNEMIIDTLAEQFPHSEENEEYQDLLNNVRLTLMTYSGGMERLPLLPSSYSIVHLMVDLSKAQSNINKDDFLPRTFYQEMQSILAIPDKTLKNTELARWLSILQRSIAIGIAREKVSQTLRKQVLVTDPPTKDELASYIKMLDNFSTQLKVCLQLDNLDQLQAPPGQGADQEIIMKCLSKVVPALALAITKYVYEHKVAPLFKDQSSQFQKDKKDYFLAQANQCFDERAKGVEKDFLNADSDIISNETKEAYRNNDNPNKRQELLGQYLNWEIRHLERCSQQLTKLGLVEFGPDVAKEMMKEHLEAGQVEKLGAQLSIEINDLYDELILPQNIELERLWVDLDRLSHLKEKGYLAAASVIHQSIAKNQEEVEKGINQITNQIKKRSALMLVPQILAEKVKLLPEGGLELLDETVQSTTICIESRPTSLPSDQYTKHFEACLAVGIFSFTKEVVTRMENLISPLISKNVLPKTAATINQCLFKLEGGVRGINTTGDLYLSAVENPQFDFKLFLGNLTEDDPLNLGCAKVIEQAIRQSLKDTFVEYAQVPNLPPEKQDDINEISLKLISIIEEVLGHLEMPEAKSDKPFEIDYEFYSSIMKLAAESIAKGSEQNTERQLVALIGLEARVRDLIERKNGEKITLDDLHRLFLGTYYLSHYDSSRTLEENKNLRQNFKDTEERPQFFVGIIKALVFGELPPATTGDNRPFIHEVGDVFQILALDLDYEGISELFKDPHKPQNLKESPTSLVQTLPHISEVASEYLNVINEYDSDQAQMISNSLLFSAESVHRKETREYADGKVSLEDLLENLERNSTIEWALEAIIAKQLSAGFVKGFEDRFHREMDRLIFAETCEFKSNVSKEQRRMFFIALGKGEALNIDHIHKPQNCWIRKRDYENFKLKYTNELGEEAFLTKTKEEVLKLLTPEQLIVYNNLLSKFSHLKALDYLQAITGYEAFGIAKNYTRLSDTYNRGEELSYQELAKNFSKQRPTDWKGSDIGLSVYEKYEIERERLKMVREVYPGIFSSKNLRPMFRDWRGKSVLKDIKKDIIEFSKGNLGVNELMAKFSLEYTNRLVEVLEKSDNSEYFFGELMGPILQPELSKQSTLSNWSMSLGRLTTVIVKDDFKWDHLKEKRNADKVVSYFRDKVMLPSMLNDKSTEDWLAGEQVMKEFSDKMKDLATD